MRLLRQGATSAEMLSIRLAAANSAARELTDDMKE